MSRVSCLVIRALVRNRHRPHALRAGPAEHCGRLAERRPRSFYIINENNRPANNPFRLDRRKRAGHIQPPLVARERNLRERLPDARERPARNLAADQSAQLPGKEFGLIESAHALASRMQRNGDEHAP